MAIGYSEGQLISNRAAVLVHGSTEAERRAWAEETTQQLGEPPLFIADTPERFRSALEKSRGVVYVPDIGSTSEDAQRLLVRHLREKDERPKWVVALQGSLNTARESGRLREDLHYALHRALVDLSVLPLRQAIGERRETAKKVAAALAASAPQPKKAAGAGRRR